MVTFLVVLARLLASKPSSPLQRLVVGVAVVLDREGDEVLDAAVFDFLEGFFDGLLAPVVLFGALAFDLDFRSSPSSSDLLRRKSQDVLTQNKRIATLAGIRPDAIGDP